MISEIKKIEKFLQEASKEKAPIGPKLADIFGDEQLAKEICRRFVDKPLERFPVQMAYAYASGFERAINLVFFFHGLKQIEDLEELYNRSN